LIAEYEDVFTGIGKLKGVTVKLHVVPEAQELFRNKGESPYHVKRSLIKSWTGDRI